MTASERSLEPAEYIAFVRRVMKAASKRVGEGDPEELVELLELRHELDAAITHAVAGLRRSGITWQQIADASGMTRQAAWEKWS